MKTRSIGIARFVERCARMACRLGAVAAFVLGASAAFAQNLAVTTLASGFNNPYGVAVDASGNAYVADTSNHVIRKITSAGVVSVLAGSVGIATWADDASANAPAARFNEPRGIAINSAGTTLYVADRLNQRIRVIGLAGVGGAVTGVTTLAGTGATGFANAGASSTFDSPVGIAINPAGDTLYVADRNNHLIRSIVIAGPAVSTVAGLQGTTAFANGNSATATFNLPSGIAVNAAGTALFVADYNNHVIRQVVLSPVAVTTYAGTQGSAGAVNNAVATSATLNFPVAVAADGSDNLYVADFGNNAVRLILAAGTNAVSTPAGGTSGSADGTGSAAQFSGPNGIAVKTISSTLFVFVADTNNQTVRKAAIAPTITLDPIAATVNTGQSAMFTANATGVPAPTFRWQRQPSGTTGFVNLSDGGAYSGTTTTTLTVSGVTTGMSGDLFRLVATNAGGSTPTANAALTVNLGTTFTTFAGLAAVAGSADGTGTSALFNNPVSIVVDSAGNFYIADIGNSVIRKMTPGGVVTTLAGLAGVRGNADGAGSAARFNSPAGVAVDTAGNVFVADTFSHTIRVVSPAGEVTTIAGSPSNSGALDGVGSAARFFLPTAVAVDATSGTIVVADSSNHAIRRVTYGGVVTTAAGAFGSAGFVNNPSPTLARFNGPNSLVVDSTGNIFVADTQNNAIRKVSAVGAVTSVAGSLTGTSGSSDGNGTFATFSRPSGLALDSGGNLFVADTNNNIIRRISTAGDVTTLAGLAGVSGSADGVGSGARFSRPYGIVLDSTGNIYIADTGNNAIRRSGSATPVQITTQPGSRTASVGQTATFGVVATGVPAPSSYQWQRQPANTSGFVNLATDSTYSGVNTATLSVANLTQSMGGDQFRVVIANGVNPAATSDAATLTVGVPPAFTSAAAASFRAGQANTFTVTADSTTTITYSATGLPAWLTFNASTGVLSGNPPDTTGSPLTLALTANNGVTATQTFTLTLLPANIPPSVATQPASQTIDPGQSVTFSVTAAGTAPFSYQWRRNGIAISGATNATLILTGVQVAGAGTYTVAITNAFGTAVSAGATLTVNQLPIIAESPRQVIVLVGGSASFSVRATGGSSFTYQWRKNGVAVLGATASTYTLNGVSAADVGNYDVIVSNNVGSVGSSLAQLTLATAPAAPVIVAQPAARTVLVGTAVTLSVGVSGAPTPTLQWRKNGTAISGANGPTLTFSNAQTSDAANYDVVATNSAGTVTSNSAGLTVIARSYAGVYFGTFSGSLGNFALLVRDDNSAVFLGYLPGGTAPVVNLRLTVSDGGQFFFSQAAVAGSSGGDDEPPRAAALGAVTVTGSIANDGTLSGAISGGVSATLSGSLAGATGATQGVAGFYQLGSPTNAVTAYVIAGPNNQAFAIILGGGTASDGGLGTLTSSGQIGIITSRSAINLTIAAASGLVTGNATGAVAAASLSGGSDLALARQRLVNISSRARVGTGDAVAIAGFVISGDESKPVLIRAVGPTLGAAPFNLTGALASPRLELFRGTTSLGTNAGIAGNRAAIDAAGAQVGAFTLGAAGTDAAMIVTLVPGNYSGVVSSTTAAAGVVLIEVYDLSAANPGQKLLNISTRASVGVGENLLIAGFVVPPGSSKRVLVRGVGPGLTPFGVTGVIAQPVLTLFNGAATVASNTNWNTSPDSVAISTGSVQVGAFGLATNDSAMVLTLAPGNYTAQVTGVGGGTGIALIEVYEMP